MKTPKQPQDTVKTRKRVNYTSMRLPNPQFEQNHGKSLTVPDQSKSLRNLLDDFTRGVSSPTDGQYRLQFTEEEYFPDPRSLDPTDLDSYKRETEQLYDKAQKSAQKLKAEHKRLSSNPAKLADAPQGQSGQVSGGGLGDNHSNAQS